MLVLKNNQIPKGLIPLERPFNQDDIPSKTTLQPQPEEVEDCNIGTNENPKMVKISKYLPTQIKSKYVDLLEKHKDVDSRPFLHDLLSQLSSQIKEIYYPRYIAFTKYSPLMKLKETF